MSGVLLCCLIVASLDPALAQTAGDSLIVTLTDSVRMDFVYIPPGTFTMGSPDSDPDALGKEKPQHEVTIRKGFYLGKYEVTQSQWEAVMGTTPWAGVRGVQEEANNPAVGVSWYDVQNFVRRLNAAARDSLYRLPTEAEWEYACRAGTTTRWSFGEGKSNLDKYACYYVWRSGDDSVPSTNAVGTKLPNPWGLFDMHGNVLEWCLDLCGAYSSAAQTDPLETVSGLTHAARGGYYAGPSRSTRSAFRYCTGPNYRFAIVGFRLLRHHE